MKIRLFALATLAGLGMAGAMVPQKSMAQVLNPQNGDNTNPSDPFYQGTEQSPFNMFQLLHNAQLGIGNLYNPEFATQQREQIDEAAAAFRARQQQAIRSGGGTQQPNACQVQQTPQTKTPGANQTNVTQTQCVYPNASQQFQIQPVNSNSGVIAPKTGN